jgi:hypothetical protein
MNEIFELVLKASKTPVSSSRLVLHSFDGVVGLDEAPGFFEFLSLSEVSGLFEVSGAVEGVSVGAVVSTAISFGPGQRLRYSFCLDSRFVSYST